mmetsp:Transcript_3419/g.6807  ORF Transcript_3419/g.6807 Transcript_3419/m.6807 type:complete len:319 (+) Transcript_3419:100-1056(+)
MHWNELLSEDGDYRFPQTQRSDLPPSGFCLAPSPHVSLAEHPPRAPRGLLEISSDLPSLHLDVNGVDDSIPVLYARNNCRHRRDLPPAHPSGGDACLPPAPADGHVAHCGLHGADGRGRRAVRRVPEQARRAAVRHLRHGRQDHHQRLLPDAHALPHGRGPRRHQRRGHDAVQQRHRPSRNSGHGLRNRRARWDSEFSLSHDPMGVHVDCVLVHVLLRHLLLFVSMPAGGVGHVLSHPRKRLQGGGRSVRLGRPRGGVHGALCPRRGPRPRGCRMVLLGSRHGRACRGEGLQPGLRPSLGRRRAPLALHHGRHRQRQP